MAASQKDQVLDGDHHDHHHQDGDDDEDVEAELDERSSVDKLFPTSAAAAQPLERQHVERGRDLLARDFPSCRGVIYEAFEGNARSEAQLESVNRVIVAEHQRRLNEGLAPQSTERDELVLRPLERSRTNDACVTANTRLNQCLIHSFCPRETERFAACMGGFPSLAVTRVQRRCLESWQALDQCMLSHTIDPALR